MHRCQSGAKTRNTREITRQERSLRSPTCPISLGAIFSPFLPFPFYSENIRVTLGLSLLQSGSRFRAANGCRDNRSRPFSLRRPTFRPGRSVQSGFIVTVTTARCHATHRRRESPDPERETAAAARFSRHILSATSRSPLRAAKRMWKAADSTASPLSSPEKVD